MDTKFENIVPWNGSNDTGRDVRLKWERNFKRIADALKELSDTDKQIIKDILKEIDKNIENGNIKDKVVVQAGFTYQTYKSKYMEM